MFGNVRDGLLVFTGIPFALTGGTRLYWLRDIPVDLRPSGFIALCRRRRAPMDWVMISTSAVCECEAGIMDLTIARCVDAFTHTQAGAEG